jgi:pSer/pThr/pTyr-binding forkhead associated (FHA) protein
MALWHLEGSLDEIKTVVKTPVTHFPFTIGRSKVLDMVILRSGISREHAEIYKKGSRLYIRDLDSTNGTFVDKDRITSDTLVRHNTTIHFAQVVFKLIDLEYKEPADEQLTMVMNIADKPKRKSKTGKSLNKSKPLASEQRINKEDKEKPRNVVKVDTIDRSPEPVNKTAPHSQSAYIVPSYSANEKIFVQGGASDSNRRIHARREAHWPAEVTLKNQQLIHCMTKDFSEIGLALSSPVSLQERTLVKVEIKVFHKGRNRPISFIGVVKHSLLTAGGFAVGIQVKHCTQDCSEFMANFSNRQI